MRPGILYLLIALAGIILHSCQQSEPQPNVLLIMTDDQGWGDFSVNGNTQIHTPVLDELARSSYSFDRFYVSPVCAPTRASLLTGRYHLRTGTTWVTHRKETMRSEEYTLAESFRDNGYVTGCFGKWHNGEHYPHDPLGQGFDEFYGFTAGHWNNYFDTWLMDGNQRVPTSGYISDVLTDRAIQFISKQREKPFFCYVPFNAPHGPFQVPDKYFERFAGSGLDDKTAAVYAMCENLDDNIGRLISVMDSLGLRENTIIVFLTDNGPNGRRYNGGMKGIKGQVDEGGIRVPLYISYPGIGPGKMSIPQISSHIDLFPTLHELCGLPVPDDIMLDGISLVPMMKAQREGEEMDRMIFTHHVQWNYKKTPGSVRTATHRLVLTPGGDTLLYDMIADPEQKNDISDSFPEVTGKLSSAYDEWIADVTAGGTEALAVPIGFEEAPRVHLPAPEALSSGGITYKGGSGWANDWFTGFSADSDSVYWPVRIVEEGEYLISAEFSTGPVEKPVTILINSGSNSIMHEIKEEINAPYLPSPDRIERGEVYERQWVVTGLDTLRLGQETSWISFRLLNGKDLSDFELKSLLINKL